MRSIRRTVRIPLEWDAEMRAYIKKNEIDVMTVSDYIIFAIAEKLNKGERSCGREGTHVYKPGEVRRGRPRKPKLEQVNV